jgi:hypothetical protein
MANVPVVCDTCGTLFVMPNIIGGTGAATVTFEGSGAGPCPNCGGMGHIPDGVYRFVGDTIELLQAPERTVSELQRLTKVLRTAQERGADFEEVKSTVEQEFPGWGQRLSRLLIPQTPADLAAYLMLILMAVQMVMQAKENNEVPDINEQTVINNITVQTPGQPPAVDSSTTIRGISDQGRKVGRNEPCPYGSGLKFKKCHGAGGESHYTEP